MVELFIISSVSSGKRQPEFWTVIFCGAPPNVRTCRKRPRNSQIEGAKRLNCEATWRPRMFFKKRLKFGKSRALQSKGMQTFGGFIYLSSGIMSSISSGGVKAAKRPN